MSKNRYKIIRGLNGEIEDIIDHCKQDKHLGFSDFMIQINEQDKAFKKLKKENMELKERNNRQYKQLNQLYKLIECKDWETLTELNNELKENEKQLQQEWKCY